MKWVNRVPTTPTTATPGQISFKNSARLKRGAQQISIQENIIVIAFPTGLCCIPPICPPELPTPHSITGSFAALACSLAQQIEIYESY